MTEVLRVNYRAAASGSEQLTWGQRVIWQAVEGYLPGEAARSMAITVPVPEGTARAVVLDAVRNLVLRYEALRTTVRRGPDGPRQDVAAAGTVDVRLVEAGADPAATLVEVAAAAGAIHFAVDRPPVAVVLVQSAGAPVTVVLGLSHFAVDAWGAGLLGQALGASLAGRDLGPVPQQPRDRARWERSADGRRAASAGVRHWRAQLAGCPPSAFPMLTGPVDRRPRAQSELRSSALPDALSAVTARLRLTPSSAVLAALALVLAARSGTDRPHPFGCLVTVGHRFPPLGRDYVGTAVQHAPVVFDVDPDSFAATGRAALPAVLAAARYGQADPDETARVAQEVARERGIRWLWATVNVVGRPGRPMSVAPPDGFHERPSGEAGGGPFELEVFDGVLRVAADPAVLPRAAVEPLLRAVMTVLVDAAAGADPTATGLGAAAADTR